MAGYRCPGQNVQFWGPKDIYIVPCTKCGHGIEFFKDDISRPCPSCSVSIYNPRVNSGCALWCPKAEDCLGPEHYASLKATKALAEQRKHDMEELLNLVPMKEADVRRLLKQLYLENADPSRLIDTDGLQAVRAENPDLFERATGWFRRFQDGRPR
ncbi:MAG: hypothetical protein ABIF71_10605 [Planctomycetota bacterium]